MIQQAHIIGTGSSMPERILSNKDLETIVDTTDEWIVRRSGIKERRISSNEQKESTTDLATQASKKALEMAEISPVDLDMIVVGTVTPDRQFPSAACMIQKALHAGMMIWILSSLTLNDLKSDAGPGLRRKGIYYSKMFAC